MNSMFEEKIFQGLVDDFADSYFIDFARQTEQSDVERLANQCACDGLSAHYISLARKAAVVQVCNPVKGVINE